MRKNKDLPAKVKHKKEEYRGWKTRMGNLGGVQKHCPNMQIFINYHNAFF